jgi:hypothetical protein
MILARRAEQACSKLWLHGMQYARAGGCRQDTGPVLEQVASDIGLYDIIVSARRSKAAVNDRK